jgi:hypothetical protein
MQQSETPDHVHGLREKLADAIAAACQGSTFTVDEIVLALIQVAASSTVAMSDENAASLAGNFKWAVQNFSLAFKQIVEQREDLKIGLNIFNVITGGKR